MPEEVEERGSVSNRDDEQCVVIPPDYARSGVVPICIRAVDDRGRVVHRGWIEAVRPISEPLRLLARAVIGDVWRVSELAEGSVHALSARHGQALGKSPSTRIYVDAKWRARDLAVGGIRVRQQLDVELRDHVLAVLKEPYDFAKAFEDREFVARLEERLEVLGLVDVSKMLQMYLFESEDQIAGAFGANGKRAKNNLAQRFRRGLQRALKLLSTSGGTRGAA